MLTRTFLFLLAMLTGISATQTANAAQVAPASVGSCTTSQAAVIAYTVAQTHNFAVSTFVEDQTNIIIVRKIALSTPGNEHYVLPPRTYRSDRSRE